jgi:HEAT repeat protein
MYPIKQIDTSSRRFALVILVTVLAVAPSLHASDADIEALRKGKIRRDDESLVKFLLSGRIDDVDTAKRDKLIGQLGSQVYKEWKGAVEGLTAMGYAAVPPLRKALKDPNAEVRDKAQHCLDLIGRVPERDTILAAIRLMMERQTPKLLEILLQVLPAAPDEDVADEVAYDIDQLACKGNRIHPTVLAALADKQAARRALAACIVGYRGNAEQRSEVAKLLKDADPLVQLRAAQGLLAAKKTDGLPVLVALLAEGSLDIAWQAEELLRYVAGKSAPNSFVGLNDDKQLQACHEAWTAWLKVQKARIDLTSAEYLTRRPGLVLLCDGDPFKDKPTFWLTGCDGTVRWEVQGKASALEKYALGAAANIAWQLSPNLASPEYKGLLYGGRWQQGSSASWLMVTNELWGQPARRYVHGLLTNGALSCGAGRVLELDEFNRIKWAAFFPRQTERGYVCAGQLRVGFAHFEKDDFDLNDTLRYRLRCAVSDNKEIRRQTSEWLELVVLPYLRMVPRGEQLYGALDLQGLENIRFARDYRRLSPTEAVRATYNRDPRVRAKAAQLLAAYYTYEAKLITPYLVRLVDDSDANVRETAIFCLCELSHERNKTLPLLLRLMSDPDPKVREGRWSPLGNLARGMPSLLPELLRLKEEDDDVYLCKYEALLKIAPHDKRLVTMLVSALKDRRHFWIAVSLLSYAGEGHQAEVVPGLIQALNMPLGQEKPHTAVKIRCTILSALGRLHGDPKVVVPVLVEYAQDKEQPDELRVAAIRALGRIGVGAQAALPALKRILAIDSGVFEEPAMNAIEDITKD